MMSPLPLPRRRVLCLGAHADDVEIGCGGTLLQWIAQKPELEITWVIWSAAGDRRAEAEASAADFLRGAARARVVIESFRDSYFPAQWEAIKGRMAEIAREVPSPDVIFTHRLEDRHQDHRVLAELTWNTFRQHLVLEYEIPKYEGDLGQPNAFVPLAPEFAQRKIELLTEHFTSQQGKYWYDPATFEAMLRVRGLEARADSGTAEAFTARKLVLA
jgi:LmbE family N-acetylglucosaminyl deacetylase